MAHLQTLDVFLLPSHREGLAGSLREAAAVGLPIIATDIGGSRDVVTHGYNGLLVPPADTRALAEAVQTMVGDYPRYRRHAVAHAERLRQVFSKANFLNQYEQVLRHLA